MQELASPFAIRVQNLVVGFGRHVVIDHLSLDVRRGEILGLVGASGGGKSVLMRTIIGLIPRQSGEIEVMGAAIGDARDRSTQSAAGRWGILFQQGALFSSLTVRQNIQFPLRENLVLSDALMDEIATAKLEMVGLQPEDGDKFPSELSGGMTKRVALARALALDPAIVFLDEPTSGLDPIAAGDFDVLIKTLQKTLGLTAQAHALLFRRYGLQDWPFPILSAGAGNCSGNDLHYYANYPSQHYYCCPNFARIFTKHNHGDRYKSRQRREKCACGS
jgi:phospholipid/cholesterol/gamma-HCH transport system ATP-binding protein